MLVSGPSELAIVGAAPDGKPTDEELEEARALFALAELANRSVKDLEPPKQGYLAEIRVEIGTGPDSGAFESGMSYAEMWTIESIRNQERLRGYVVEREGSMWTAVPKA